MLDQGILLEELTVTAISPKLVPSAFPLCDDHHGGVSRRFQDARHKTVIYDSCNPHTYCMNRDPLLFKHTWFLMDRLHWKNHKADMFEDDSVYTYEPTADLFARSHDDSVYTYDPSADLFARSHDDSSMEGVTESSTVGCPVADADMAESNQETAIYLRTVIPETQVHGQVRNTRLATQQAEPLDLRTVIPETQDTDKYYSM
ncbi:hypothetical protein Bbelb_051930 [Branchiostoma belcheri]|nr:hypothetical protein Bbelb_051930 [Branchiostoma belcheri]